jgi:hypothetical protein
MAVDFEFTDRDQIGFGKDAPEPDEGEDIRRIVEAAASDAVKYIDQEVSPAREELARYFRGELVAGLEVEEGRSSVVMNEVRNSILGIIPSFMRLIFGPERVAEFAPKNPETVEQAAQQTEYVSHVLLKENPGFVATYDAVHDGLLKRLGGYKWGWEKGEPERVFMHNLAPDEAMALRLDETVTVLEEEENEDGTVNMRLEQAGDAGRCWIMAIPPEELVYSREAKSPNDALFIGHRSERTTSDLLKSGVSKEDIEKYGGKGELKYNFERMGRQREDSHDQDPEVGKASQKHEWIEGYMELDLDGEGIATLCRVNLLGPTRHMIGDPEPVSRVPISTWTPYREPHAMAGFAQADLTKDLHRVKTNLTRTALDSASLSIFPRTAHQSGMVNVEDLANNEIGANIETYGPPEQVMKSFTHQFLGRELFPFLEYVDASIERATGRSAGASGLDIDALQSTEKAAAKAAVTASQEQVELMVRMFVESAFKPLLLGIRDMLITYQPRSKMVKMRGHWVPVDPRIWDANLSVDVKATLGSGLIEQKVLVMQGLAGKMEALIQQMGEDNPLAGLMEYRKVLAEATRLSGIEDVDSYWKPVTPEQLQQRAMQQAMTPPPPSPEQLNAQAAIEVEQMKTMKEMELKQRELELKRQEIMLLDDRDRERMALEHAAKLRELELKYRTTIDAEEMRAAVAAERAELDRTTAELDADVRREEIAARTEVEERKLMHDSMNKEADREVEIANAEADRQHEATEKAADRKAKPKAAK